MGTRSRIKSEVRSDLRGCLEVIVASKPHFLYLSPIHGSSFLLLTRNKFLLNSSKMSPKIFKNFSTNPHKSPSNQILHFPRVSRNSIRSEPCCPLRHTPPALARPACRLIFAAPLLLPPVSTLLTLIYSRTDIF